MRFAANAIANPQVNQEKKIEYGFKFGSEEFKNRSLPWSNEGSVRICPCACIECVAAFVRQSLKYWKTLRLENGRIFFFEVYPLFELDYCNVHTLEPSSSKPPNADAIQYKGWIICAIEMNVVAFRHLTCLQLPQKVGHLMFWNKNRLFVL